MRSIFDIEVNGLLNELTCIHCLILLNLDSGEIISYRPNQYAFEMAVSGKYPVMTIFYLKTQAR
jgi:hypothetical protein